MRSFLLLLAASLLSAPAFAQKSPKENAQIWLGVNTSIKAAADYSLHLEATFPGESDPLASTTYTNEVNLSTAVSPGDLKLHIYPGRSRGWCITKKMPLFGKDGTVVGLIGTSQDLGLLDDLHPAYRQIARIAQHISENYQQNISLKALAEEAGLSLSRVERLFQKVFQHSPRQLLVQCRLSAARTLIEQNPAAKIAAIAYECGYTDHSAFSRQFKSYVGMSPTEYGLHVKKSACG